MGGFFEFDPNMCYISILQIIFLFILLLYLRNRSKIIEPTNNMPKIILSIFLLIFGYVFHIYVFNIYYDVYLREGELPTEQDIIAHKITNTSFYPKILKKDTTYYWNIVATDEHNDTSSSAIWYFTTEDSISPIIKMIKPQKGFSYRNNGTTKKTLFIPWISIVFGDIIIEADVIDNNSGIKNVDLYINNDLVESFIEEPYTYFWLVDKFNRNKLEIIAYDNAGNVRSDKIIVWSIP